MLWTGSCNFTGKAYQTNEENSVIFKGDAVNNYRKQFEKIRQRVEKHKKDNRNNIKKENRKYKGRQTENGIEENLDETPGVLSQIEQKEGAIDLGEFLKTKKKNPVYPVHPCHYF